jgi:hypothetical protein
LDDDPELDDDPSWTTTELDDDRSWTTTPSWTTNPELDVDWSS